MRGVNGSVDDMTEMSDVNGVTEMSDVNGGVDSMRHVSGVNGCVDGRTEMIDVNGNADVRMNKEYVDGVTIEITNTLLSQN